MTVHHKRYGPGDIRTVRIKHHGAQIINVRGRFFAWIGELDQPHYIAHALTEERVVALLRAQHENLYSPVESFREKVCQYAATVLRIGGHPSGEDIYLGFVGSAANDALMAHAKTKEGCLRQLAQAFDGCAQ